jgi:succinate dehydrogenase / fumarate reductase flavoprotein subunit
MDFAGIDPIEKPIPVQPSQHYSMGGISTNSDCSTSLKGLYAVGECACLSVHGANRLGGNSLLETIVFGKIAGESVSNEVINYYMPSSKDIEKSLYDEISRLESILKRDFGEPLFSIRDNLKRTMFDYFGIFREEKKMQQGLVKIEELKKKIRNVKINSDQRLFNHSLVHTLELENMILIGEVVGISSISRKESRGSHFRTDFPNRNDQDFLAHSITYIQNGALLLEYYPVTLGIYPITERKY